MSYEVVVSDCPVIESEARAAERIKEALNKLDDLFRDRPYKIIHMSQAPMIWLDGAYMRFIVIGQRDWSKEE